MLQTHKYQNFPSPLSNAGEVKLPYSGTYHNPGYNPSTPGNVHAYDIGGTLAGAKGRDDAIRRILSLSPDADIKSVLFNDDNATRRISKAQEQGILKGEFNVDALEGVVNQLSVEQSFGEDAVMITAGTYQMARSFLYGARLEDYVSALVTSEEAETRNKKTVDIFVRAYEKLQEKGKIIQTYCDDSEGDAKAAVEASNIVENRYGKGFTIYLIKKDATEEELGPNKTGYTVIRSIDEKCTEKSSKNEGPEKGGDSDE